MGFERSKLGSQNTPPCDKKEPSPSKIGLIAFCVGTFKVYWSLTFPKCYIFILFAPWKAVRSLWLLSLSQHTRLEVVSTDCYFLSLNSASIVVFRIVNRLFQLLNRSLTLLFVYFVTRLLKEILHELMWQLCTHVICILPPPTPCTFFIIFMTFLVLYEFTWWNIVQICLSGW